MSSNAIPHNCKWLALGWTMIIAGLSLLPADHAVIGPFGDKWDHLAAYTVLAGLVTLAGNGCLKPWQAAVLAAGYGALLEALQLIVPGRFSEWQDLPTPWARPWVRLWQPYT